MSDDRRDFRYYTEKVLDDHETRIRVVERELAVRQEIIEEYRADKRNRRNASVLWGTTAGGVIVALAEAIKILA